MLACVGDSERDDYLQERYGRSKRGRRAWLAPAIVLAVVGGAWLIWSANHFSRPEIRSELISFSVVNPKKVSLHYEIRVRSAKRSHTCILKASDFQANVVGEVTDAIPAGSYTYSRTIEIPTRADAVSATIDHCF